MSVHVIEEETKHDGVKGVVCFESDIAGPGFYDAIVELQHPSVKQLAIQVAARQGLPDPGVEFPEAPFAIDTSGNVIERPTEQKIHRYRVMIPVSRRMR